MDDTLSLYEIVAVSIASAGVALTCMWGLWWLWRGWKPREGPPEPYRANRRLSNPERLVRAKSLKRVL